MHFKTIFASFFLATAVVAAPFGMPSSSSNPLSSLPSPTEALNEISNAFTKVEEAYGSGNEGNGDAGNGNKGNGNAGNGNKDNGEYLFHSDHLKRLY